MSGNCFRLFRVVNPVELYHCFGHGNKVERRNGDKKDQYSLDIDHHEATAEPQDLKSIQGTLQLFYSSIANGFQQLNYERY